MATQLDKIRDAGERDLSGVLNTVNARYRREIEQAARENGGIQNIPQEFWDRMQQDIEEESAAMLLLLILAAHGDTTDRIKRQGVTPSGVGGQKLADYARKAAQQAETLAGSYVDTTRQRITDLQAAGETLKKSTQYALNKSRAESGAITTTTTGISTGQTGAAGDGGEERRTGQRVDVELVWVTEQDSKVCPICRPLNGTTEDVWGLDEHGRDGPPAHPNCRCHLSPRVIAQSAAA